MKTTIINIGNSRGVRIPKPLLEESSLANEVAIKAKKGEIKIIATKKEERPSVTVLLSESPL